LFLALATWQESGWLAFATILMAAMFGGAFVIFVRRTIVIFDRDAGAVVIRSKTLLGQTETSHALTRVSRASVETTISRSTSSGRGSRTSSETHRTVLYLGDEVVPLTEVYTAGDSAERMAKAINDWLAQ
ncbi:MAG: hypothetical protein JNN02_11875, partial [Tabrizicola sp.]|nr:hypothetical protein [Tabrizicola sp.]